MKIDPSEYSYGFRRFYHAFFEETDYMKWHDGVDTSSVYELEGEERDLAVTLLLNALSPRDSFIPQGLAALRSLRAVPQLKEILPRSSGSARVKIALALWQLAADPEAIDQMIGVLHSQGTWGTRIDAAISLRHAHVPQVAKALLQALGDEEYLVRHHACVSLFALCGFSADDGSEPYHEISVAIMSDDPDIRGEATEQIQAITALHRHMVPGGGPYSAAFHRAFVSYFGALPTIFDPESLDDVSLLGLDTSERDVFRRELLRTLESGNWRSVLGCATLGIEKATKQIALMLTEEKPTATRLSAALALLALDGRETVLETVISVLQGESDWAVRQAAAKTLGEFPTNSSVTALLVVLDDDEALVRYEAGKALSKMASSRSDIDQTLIHEATTDLLSDPDKYIKAAEIIRNLYQNK